jgi:2-methylisocitrate lyase-like PEP mutase family enzyme
VETGRTPLLTPAELDYLGFRLVVSPLSALLTAAAAIRSSLELLRDEGSLRDHLDRLVKFDDFTALVGLPELLDVEARYGATS